MVVLSAKVDFVGGFHSSLPVGVAKTLRSDQETGKHRKTLSLARIWEHVLFEALKLFKSLA
jgi:hypothetical protein